MNPTAMKTSQPPERGSDDLPALPLPFALMVLVTLVVTAAVILGSGWRAMDGMSVPASAPESSDTVNDPSTMHVAHRSISGLHGTVGGGAPIVGGRLRVVDATGTVVAEEVEVAANGSYTVAALAGSGPYRIEACVDGGPNFRCLLSVAQGPGTANVTPLTTAVALLASGRSPTDLMTGTAAGLSTDGVAAAQAQLRNHLGSVLTAAVPAHFDFVTGELSAGARTGYDRVLDSIGIATGVDGSPFVQISPRLGKGNLYLQTGQPASGAITLDTAAADLDLSGLDALFAGITRAMASPESCASAATGITRWLSTSAHFSVGLDPIRGARDVGTVLCLLFNDAKLWGATLLSPTLGRCDTSGAVPACNVGMTLRRAGSDRVEAMAGRFAVARENGTWKFVGDADRLPIRVSSRVQRERRIDGDTPVDYFRRAISLDIAAVPGVACARVDQRSGAGFGSAAPSAAPSATTSATTPTTPGQTTIAWLKPTNRTAERLSIWRVDGRADVRADVRVATARPSPASLDPTQGALQGTDDHWLELPAGDAGDSVVRNFFRHGRTLIVSLFADASCQTLFSLDGRTTFEVDLDGVPPVWASMPNLPWPELTAGARDALVSSKLGGALRVDWTFPHGPVGVELAAFCADQSRCGPSPQPGQAGPSGPSRERHARFVSQIRVEPHATGVDLWLRRPGAAAAAGGTRRLAIEARLADGLAMQSGYLACASQPLGQDCR